MPILSLTPKSKLYMSSIERLASPSMAWQLPIRCHKITPNNFFRLFILFSLDKRWWAKPSSHFVRSHGHSLQKTSRNMVMCSYHVRLLEQDTPSWDFSIVLAFVWWRSRVLSVGLVYWVCILDSRSLLLGNLRVRVKAPRPWCLPADRNS